MSNAVTLSGPTYHGKVDAIGGAGSFELSIGGAISPGIIIAGSYLAHTVGDATLKNDTRTSRYPHDPTLSMLAATLDVYPNAKRGFHLGAALGLAAISIRADEDPEAKSGQSGGGIAPHIGYEWWAGNYWGLGVLGRFFLARSQGDYADGTEKNTVSGAAIYFSATYN
jgi:hypothetical protein